MENEELHLFLIWEKGRFEEKHILDDIKKNFTLLKVVDVVWNPDSFKVNLSRFYGKKLKKSYKKEKSTGTGAFALALVLDKDASNHIEGNKNTKMVQFKVKYRQWTGGGHLVHASDCASEANENLLFLFGQTAEELKENYAKLPDIFDHGLLAEKGFADEKDLSDLINKLPLAVEVNKNKYKSKKPSLLARFLNAQKRAWFFGSTAYRVRIGNKWKNIRLVKG